MGGEDIRRDAQRCFMGGERLVEAVQFGQRHAAIGDRRRVTRIDGQRPVIATERFGEALVLDAGIAAVDQGGEVFRSAVSAPSKLVSASSKRSSSNSVVPRLIWMSTRSGVTASAAS